MFPRAILACLVLILAANCGTIESNSVGDTPTTIPPSPVPILITPSFLQETQIGALHSPETTIAVDNPTVTPTPLSQVCSPLYGFQLLQLGEIISTPYDPPPPGQDSGHHGVDFGFYSYGAFAQMEGLPVQSVLSGQVAAVIEDRPPYGNMIIVETPFSSLPLSWRNYLSDLPPLSEYKVDGRLACPDLEPGNPIELEKSLYILYAHLSDPPTLSMGDKVGCGQQLGFVGTTGFSVNAHLHMETRLGPVGVQFLHLAHYVNNATAEEMANYCTWRISRNFRLIDPLALLQLNP